MRGVTGIPTWRSLEFRWLVTRNTRDFAGLGLRLLDPWTT